MSDALIAAQRKCIALERDAEKLETEDLHDTVAPAELQRRGVALVKLHVTAVETALFGRALLTLQLTMARPLPPTKLTPGAMVFMRPSTALAGAAATGTVTSVRENLIKVSFEEMPEEEQLAEPLVLALSYSDVTYRRIEFALAALAADKPPPHAAPMCAMLLQSAEQAAGRRPPVSAAPLAVERLYNPNLNEGQRVAVAFALECPEPVALIHGPPGTGKTTAVVELIRQAVRRGQRVLATAASNVAVDNMAERLLHGSGKAVKIVRVGHPARLLPSVMGAALDARLATSDGAAIVRDVKKDIDAARLAMRGARSKGVRAGLQGEVSKLRKELKAREQKSVVDLLTAAQVVLCTNTGAQDRALRALPPEHAFDVVVIDEAAQALEAACWVPLLRGRRAVLAGDHRQLPPVVKSAEAAAQGFGVTLFERLLRDHGDGIGVMLTTQYRMHASICDWASAELYVCSSAAEACGEVLPAV